MELGDFLKRELSNGSPWNCSTFPADWCLERGYPDFAAAWRHITDDAEARAVVEEAGGLVPLWNRGVGDALPVVADQHAGDIAVLAAFGLEAGGIWTGQRWALRRARGLHFITPEVFVIRKAWRP